MYNSNVRCWQVPQWNATMYQNNCLCDTEYANVLFVGNVQNGQNCQNGTLIHGMVAYMERSAK